MTTKRISEIMETIEKSEREIIATDLFLVEMGYTPSGCVIDLDLVDSWYEIKGDN